MIGHKFDTRHPRSSSMTNLKTGIWTMGKEGCSSSIEGFYSSEVKRREENIIQKFFLFHVGFRYDDYLRKWWYTIECRKRDLRTLFVSNLNNSNFRYRGKHSRSPAISILRFIPRDTRRSLFTPVSRSSEIYLFFELFWEKVRKINKLVFL